MRTTVFATLLLLLGASALAADPGPALPEGTDWIDYAGYAGCVLLENDHTRVVLGPLCGGRILEYSWEGRNALYLNAGQNGWDRSSGTGRIDPCAGRFDVGPEMVIPKHPDLWLGSWEAEITGPRQARMTSVKDKATGLQLVREFVLDASSSHLICTQKMVNVSQDTQRCCHWSRTLAKGNGICLVPLTPYSRFPAHYVMYGPGRVMDYRPKDPNIRVRDGFLEILGTPERPKLGIDSYEGWLCYLMPGDLMFVKRFPTYPDRVYGEMAAYTISIWYYKDLMCELEPIGPLERIAPGSSASFTEEWWLVPYPFPDQRDGVDLEAVAQHVGLQAR